MVHNEISKMIGFSLSLHHKAFTLHISDAVSAAKLQKRLITNLLVEAKLLVPTNWKSSYIPSKSEWSLNV